MPAMPLTWVAPLDPQEIKDYSNSWQAEMTATSDTLTGSTFRLPSDAIAAGVLIHSQSMVGNVGVVFFKINVSDQGSVAWDSPGTIFRIPHQVTTAGGRTLEISIFLTVMQK